MNGDDRPNGPDAPEGRAVETSVRTAWRAYLDHTCGCEECGRRLYNCDAGKALWEAYRTVRGPRDAPFVGRPDGSPIAPEPTS